MTKSCIGRNTAAVSRWDRWNWWETPPIAEAVSYTHLDVYKRQLQDHKRAIILGEKSFGKGSVQTVVPVSYTHLVSRSGNKASPYFLPLLTADGNILKIRVIGSQAPGIGNKLIIGRMDAIILIKQRKQRITIG